jgi:hypothetical protein
VRIFGDDTMTVLVHAAGDGAHRGNRVSELQLRGGSARCVERAVRRCWRMEVVVPAIAFAAVLCAVPHPLVSFVPELLTLWKNLRLGPQPLHRVHSGAEMCEQPSQRLTYRLLGVRDAMV